MVSDTPQPPTPSPSHPLTSSPSHPPLSPHDESLLHALSACNFNFFELAREKLLTLPQLIAWASSEPIQHYIAELKKLARLTLELRHDQARTAAIDALEHVAKTTDDLTEKRRAATALLRKLDAIPQARTLGPDDDTSDDNDSGLEDAGLRTSSHDSGLQDSGPRTSSDGPRTSALSPDSLRAPLPDVADTISYAFLRAPTIADALTALHSALAPKCNFLKQDAPTDLDDFLEMHDSGPLADFFNLVDKAERILGGGVRGLPGSPDSACFRISLKVGTPPYPDFWFWLKRQEKGPRRGQALIMRADREDSDLLLDADLLHGTDIQPTPPPGPAG